MDDGASLRLMSTKGFTRIMKKTTQGLVVHLFAIDVVATDNCSIPAIQQLLVEFSDVFTEPTCLPPVRELEHQIQLLPGASAAPQKPHRYSYVLKDDIEKTVKELPRFDSTKF